jgi:DNA-binding HxlR family transcriptional regulator
MPAWNPYASACPTRSVLELGLLAHGPLRFNQLRRQIEGLSQKMLSQTLKGLERDGLVSRKVIPTVPVTVEYRLTPLGQTLTATVEALRGLLCRNLGLRYLKANVEVVMKATLAAWRPANAPGGQSSNRSCLLPGSVPGEGTNI